MTIRSQRPIKGGRLKINGSVLKELQREITQTARKFHCSKSFVVATALSEAFGIRIEKYYEVQRLRRVK